MRKRVLVGSIAITSIFSACSDGNIPSKVEAGMPDFTENTMDLTVDPGEDFYLYANGNWKRNNPMPDDKSRYGAFDKLAEKSEEDNRALIEEIAATKHQKGTSAQRIGDLYNLAMDSVKLEEDGIKPIEADLAKISSMKTTDEVVSMLTYLHSQGVSSLFGFGGSADMKNSKFVIGYLGQGGLSMSDKEYYTSDEENIVDIRAAFLKHVEKMFILCGENQESAKSKADNILKFETQIAEAWMSKEDRRDPHKTYNKVSFSELQKTIPNIDWDNYLKILGVEYRGDFNISQPDFFKTVNTLLSTTELSVWKDYFSWHIIDGAASYLNRDLTEQNFDFYGRTMSGQPEMSARWKRVNRYLNGALGEEIGKLYVQKFFPPRAKKRMEGLVGNLKKGLAIRIDELEWMSKPTKTKALEKLDAVRVKVGYPNKWTDYSGLKIDNKLSLYENLVAADKFNSKLHYAKIGKDVDPEEWFMNPQTVNAYYHPLNNEIVFPAAILQPPFFYMDADDAVNYGAIGVVIGHEITHGFDDKGRLFDKDGNLNTWWTEEDSEKFEKRTEVLVDRFDNFVVIDDMHANGNFTLGENIADLGGLNISFTAMKESWNTTPKVENIDGFTPEQRFFLAYSRVWAQNIRDKEIVRRTNEDEHSLGKFRVIGPLPNIEAWYKAFNITESSPLYLPVKDRASIW